MTRFEDQCFASIDVGLHKDRGITRPMYRKHCKNRKLKGYQHCRHHLTLDERKRYERERSV